MRRTFPSPVGGIFGRLTVLEKTEKRSGRCIVYRCLCSCGSETLSTAPLLNSGKKQSCGCLWVDVMARDRVHGHAHAGKQTKEYRTWSYIMARCYNPNATSYPGYGGSGVCVHERWHRFEGFLADMGEAPTGKPRQISIERLDPAKSYGPGNCVWATTAKQQQRNRKNTVRLTFQGRTQPLVVWAEELGVRASKIRKRLELGWTHEKTLTTP